MHTFSIEDTKAINDYPNLVRELLTEYAWQLHAPSNKREAVDSCLLFKEAVPREYIEAVETVEEKLTTTPSLLDLHT